MWHRWAAELAAAKDYHNNSLIEKKEFKAKVPQLPTLMDYKNPAPDSFWEKFPTNMRCPAKSSVSGEKLKQLIDTVGCSDRSRVQRTIQRLEKGATIGCTGDFRLASKSKNSPDTYRFGPQVSDAVATWVVKGFAYGPVEGDKVPPGAKISGIMVREKPDNSVRIILNLSAPKGRSVNDGIDAAMFPAVMSSTDAWLAVLNKAGKNCWITKIDFADAYKHVAVCEEDTDLQWFEWGGKYFKELCLIFGSASSAGIFDDLAKVVLDIVCRCASFPSNMVCQHLDDMCAAAADKSKLTQFDKKFTGIAGHIGVKLAPRDDPEKSFGPAQRGVVFGILYDTRDWTWQIPEKKLRRLIECIDEARLRRSLRDKEVQSLVGKLINIKPLVPSAKFNMAHIMKMLAASHRCSICEVDEHCDRQLAFWRVILVACSGKLSIPDNVSRFPAWAVEAYTDAAGGTLENLGRGTGGVCMDQWFYYPWSKAINSGTAKLQDSKISRKLSALELVGPLILVSAMADKLTHLPVRIWVDNAGSVHIWKKGYSNNCDLCSTLVTAIGAVTAAHGIRLDISKVTRCSGVGPTLADHLSKAQFTQFRAHAQQNNWALLTEPLAIPAALVRWLHHPVPDQNLGESILRELATRHNVLGYSATTHNVFPT